MLGKYLRIRPGTDISINTPILYVTIGYGHLNKVKDSIYDVDIESIWETLRTEHAHMFESRSHIDDYVPVGQVESRIHVYEQSTRHAKDPNVSIILANRRVIPMTNEYEMISPNNWIGKVAINGTKMQTIGTIYSPQKPKVPVPVFPVTYLRKVSFSEPNYDVYTISDYGRYVLNDTALNIDKRNLRMIDTAGEISLIPSHTYVPMSPGDIFSDDVTGLDAGYNRKVYFTTQGTIANDPNCVAPRGNMMKMHQMECNGIARRQHVSPNMTTAVAPSDISVELTLNENVTNSEGSNDGVKSVTGSKQSKQSEQSEQSRHSNKRKSTVEAYSNVSSDKDQKMPNKKVIIREKDEPWFVDPEIVGDIADYDDPHTVTGHHETLAMTDSELYNVVESLKPKGSLGTLTGDSDSLVLIGTFDGDAEEVNMPYVSDCAVDPVIGYSRYDTLQKCLGNTAVNGQSKSAASTASTTPPTAVAPTSLKRCPTKVRSVENYANVENHNSYILWVICLTIVILMAYKISQSD